MIWGIRLRKFREVDELDELDELDGNSEDRYKDFFPLLLPRAKKRGGHFIRPAQCSLPLTSSSD